jgi:hypothetical protein
MLIIMPIVPTISPNEYILWPPEMPVGMESARGKGARLGVGVKLGLYNWARSAGSYYR